MGAGAYAVPIVPVGADQPTIVPLPPVGGTGAVPFTDAWLSFCFDTFSGPGAEIDIEVRILAQLGGEPRFSGALRLPVGRSNVIKLQPGDLTAAVWAPPQGSFNPPSVTAFVEYLTA